MARAVQLSRRGIDADDRDAAGGGMPVRRGMATGEGKVPRPDHTVNRVRAIRGER